MWLFFRHRWKDVPKIIGNNYDFIDQTVNELIEINSISSRGISDFLENSEDEFVFGVESEDFSGH